MLDNASSHFVYSNHCNEVYNAFIDLLITVWILFEFIGYRLCFITLIHSLIPQTSTSTSEERTMGWISIIYRYIAWHSGGFQLL